MSPSSIEMGPHSEILGNEAGTPALAREEHRPGPAMEEPAPLRDSADFDIHGYKLRIVCSIPSVLSGLADDFAFFRSPSVESPMVITLLDQRPDYRAWATARAAVYTPRNVAYKQDGKTIIDYSGRGLAVHDPAKRSFELSSLDHDLLYEATYLFVLSQAGESFDRHHLHRMHALGICVDGRAALVLLPMGGGKSTLCAALLRCPEVQMLSDDSPLIDDHGNVHAFPLRIGLLPGSDSGFPPEQLRTIQRMEFGPKLLVNYKYFAQRVCAQAEPALLLIGERGLDRNCTLRPASAGAIWKALIANCVVGLGLFQGMEFIFGRSRSEIFGKLAVAWSRFRACRRLRKRSRAFHLTLGRDFDRNAEVVLAALRDKR